MAKAQRELSMAHAEILEQADRMFFSTTIHPKHFVLPRKYFQHGMFQKYLFDINKHFTYERHSSSSRKMTTLLMHLYY